MFNHPTDGIRSAAGRIGQLEHESSSDLNDRTITKKASETTRTEAWKKRTSKTSYASHMTQSLSQVIIGVKLLSVLEARTWGQVEIPDENN